MWDCIVSEPVVRDASVDGEAVIADLVPGKFGNLRLCHYYIHVVDTDAKSYLSHLPIAVLAEAEKKRKYCDATPASCHLYTIVLFG